MKQVNKIKVFLNLSSEELETEVNYWLRKNPEIEIQGDTFVGEDNESNESVVYIIRYKKEV
jgi:hypothetical protein